MQDPEESQASKTDALLTAPNLGEAEDNFYVTQLQIEVGIDIHVDHIVLECSSDKATIEIPSPFGGRVVELLISAGSPIAEGDAIAIIDLAGDPSRIANARRLHSAQNGLRYLASSQAQPICSAIPHYPRYHFRDLQSRVEWAIRLAQGFRTDRLAELSDANSNQLQDAVFRLTHVLSRMRDVRTGRFGWRAGVECEAIRRELVTDFPHALQLMYGALTEARERWCDAQWQHMDKFEAEWLGEQRDIVFVVHGRDAETLDSTVGFLRQVVEADIEQLSETINKGRTLIEKFEAIAHRARFAVILATPDDEGRLAGGNQVEARARQNVIFELGYFYAKLGPSRVCIVRKSGEDEDPPLILPSDVSGVTYLDASSKNWTTDLASELRGAGLNVELNRLLK